MRVILGRNTEVDLDYKRFCTGCRFCRRLDDGRRCELFGKALVNNATPPRLEECWKAEAWKEGEK